MDSEQSSGNSIQITYVGMDNIFLEDFKENINKLAKNSNFAVQFKKINVPDGSFPSTFKKLWQSPPTLLILDFASYSAEGDLRFDYLMGLCSLVRQDAKTKDCTLVALHDYLVKDQAIEQVLMAGVRYNFIKSSENDVLPNTIFRVIKTIELPEFLIAIPEAPLHGLIKLTMRIGYLTKDLIRIETNSQLKINDEIQLSDHPIDIKKPVKCMVSEPDEGAQYYHLSRAYYLKFLSDDGLKTSHSTKHLSDEYCPKWVRVFIFDAKLEFIDDDLPLFTSLPFTIKIESDINNAINKLKTYRPHIIVTQSATAGDIEIINREKVDQPILLQFGCKTGEALTSSENLSFEYICQIHKTFEKKNPFNRKGQFFFSNYDPKVIASIGLNIKILGFNECLLFFTCEDMELTEGTVLRMSQPFDALVTIIPNEETNEKLKDGYCGLLNFMSEDQLRAIRQQFHFIFTADAREKRMNDAAELAEKNKEYIVQKEKEEQEKQEEAVKQAAAKEEAAKQEAARLEAAKEEAAKEEAAKEEAAKEEAAKQEAAKEETAKEETTKEG